MQGWDKIGPGEFKSGDRRFRIYKTWDKEHGNHWLLIDNTVSSYSGSLTHCISSPTDS